MIVEIISILLISLGCVMMFTAALGLIRFSDIYMRIHASGKAETGGTIALLTGILIRIGLTQVSAKILLIMIFILFTGPILSHAIARAAHHKSEVSDRIPFHDVEKEGSFEKRDEKRSDEDDD